MVCAVVLAVMHHLLPVFNPSEVFDASKHMLDGIAMAAQKRREARFPGAVDPGPNIGCHSHSCDLAAQRCAFAAVLSIGTHGGGPTGGRQYMEYVPLGIPAHKAVIGRLVWSIDIKGVHPPASASR